MTEPQRNSQNQNTKPPNLEDLINQRSQLQLLEIMIEDEVKELLSNTTEERT